MLELLIILLLMQEKNPDWYQQGLDILSTTGPDAAITFYQPYLEDYTKGPLAAYGTAWALMRKGAFEQSRQLANGLLTGRKYKPEFIGNVYYLLAHLDDKTEKFDDAVVKYSIAVNHYEKSGYKFNKRLALMGQVNSLICSNRLEAASALLSSLEAHENDPVRDEIEARLHFWNGEYKQALDKCLSALDGWEKKGKTSRIANLMCGISLTYLVLGENDKAFEYADRADELIGRENYEEIALYNAINWMLISHLSGEEKERERMEQAIQARIEDDYELRRLFQFAQGLIKRSALHER